MYKNARNLGILRGIRDSSSHALVYIQAIKVVEHMDAIEVGSRTGGKET